MLWPVWRDRGAGLEKYYGRIYTEKFQITLGAERLGAAAEDRSRLAEGTRTQAAGQAAPILTQEKQIGIESSGRPVVGTGRRRNELSAI